MYKELSFTPKGIHKLGGQKTKNLTIPKNNFQGGIQYIGTISNQDSLFNWLPFDFNIIAPIYSDFNGIYIDYQDENNPKIIGEIDPYDLTSAYDELDENTDVIFEERFFEFIDKNEITEDDELEIFGIAKKPFFGINDELEITCPRSNEKMDFICQISSWTEIPIKQSNIDIENSENQEELSNLNFWTDSSLFIYFNPNSKIACCFIQ